MVSQSLMHNPCYKCTDRFAVCHLECEKYKTWLEEYRKSYKERRLQQEFQDYLQERYPRLTKKTPKKFETGHL